MTDQSYTFKGYPPHDPREIRELIKRACFVVMSSKPTTPEIMSKVFDASQGKLKALKIPNFSLLQNIERESFAPYPAPSLCSLLEKLEIDVSFQPRAKKQLEGLVGFIRASKVTHMELGASEYPTDAFLKEEKYQVGRKFNDDLAALFPSLPKMLGVESPMQKRQAEIEDDGRRFGILVAEATTGIKVPTVVDPFQAKIDSVLNQALLGGGGGGAAAVTTVAVAQAQQQQLTRAQVRENAVMELARMNEVPKFQYMTEREWTEGIEILTSTELPSTLVKLSLRMLFPTATSATPIRILSGLDNLRELCLAYCGIDDAILVKITPNLVEMPVLEILDLTRNNLTDANLRPIVEGMTSLTTLVLQRNKLNGASVARLFDGLVVEPKDKLHTLSHINLSYNPFYGGGLSFIGLTAWKPKEAATLHLPNIFPPDIVEALERIMPDGSTLLLEGEFPENRSAYEPDAMLTLLYGDE